MNSWGTVGSLAILVAAMIVISAGFDLMTRRDQGRGELKALLAQRIADPAASFFEPDSLLLVRARQWSPLAKRYPDSQLAWDLSAASVGVAFGFQPDSTATEGIQLLVWGNADALALHQPHIAVTSVAADTGADSGVPLWWYAVRADSERTRWEAGAPVRALLPGMSEAAYANVALACTTYILPADFPDRASLEPGWVHRGAVPRGLWLAAEQAAIRRHVGRIESLVMLPPKPSPRTEY